MNFLGKMRCENVLYVDCTALPDMFISVQRVKNDGNDSFQQIYVHNTRLNIYSRNPVIHAFMHNSQLTV